MVQVLVIFAHSVADNLLFKQGIWVSMLPAALLSAKKYSLNSFLGHTIEFLCEINPHEDQDTLCQQSVSDITTLQT